MKLFCCILFTINAGISLAGYKIGDEAADFKLRNVDGSQISLSDFSSSRGVMVVFISNDCLTSIWYEDRIIELSRTLSKVGWKTIAINSCSTADGPDETLEGMVKRVEDKNFEFPYLRDSLQTVAHAFGTAYVPTVFLLRSTGSAFEVGYIGTIDDAPEPGKKIHNKYVEWAVEAFNANAKPDTPMAKVSGCGIKFKK